MSRQLRRPLLTGLKLICKLPITQKTPCPPSSLSKTALIDPNSRLLAAFHPQSILNRDFTSLHTISDFPQQDSQQGSAGRLLFHRFIAAGTAVSAAAAAGGTVQAKESVPPSKLPETVVLYQYEACPFCNKVKAFLDYHDVPYKVVEVNPVGKKELKWSEYKKVPVLVVDGEQLNDSTEIITLLDARFKGQSGGPRGSSAEEETWRKWVDSHLVHLLSPNIYRTPTEALEAFEYITTNGNFSSWERAVAKYTGAVSMYFVAGRLKKRHNIGDERQDLYKAAEEWVEALGKRNFLGGDKPNLADLAVFGVLRPIRNMQTGKDLMENTKIGPWYERMEEEVGASSRLPAESS